MKEKKFLTWQELKDFCNKLPELQLKKHVHWWGEERGGKMNAVIQLQEDFVTTDEGIEPLSVQDEPDDGFEPYPITHPKGTPILETD